MSSLSYLLTQNSHSSYLFLQSINSWKTWDSTKKYENYINKVWMKANCIQIDFSFALINAEYHKNRWMECALVRFVEFDILFTQNMYKKVDKEYWILVFLIIDVKGRKILEIYMQASFVK